MKAWQLFAGFITTTLVIMVCLWIYMHERAGRHREAGIEASRAAIEAISDHLSLTMVCYTSDDRVHVAIRKDGEDPDVFLARSAVERLSASPTTSVSWTSTCHNTNGTTYIIEIIAPTQAELDDLVARYCASHDCDECP